MTQPLYARPKDLATNYSLSESTVARLKKFIKDHPERYAEDAVVDYGGKTRIRCDCFHDAFRHRAAIERGIARSPDPMLKKTIWLNEG